MNRIALHIHTNHSDGQLTVAELWAEAKNLGLGGIGICDHHSMAGVEEALAKGIPHVAGVECTCLLCGDGVHLVGYFPDYVKHSPAQGMAEVLAAGKTDSQARVMTVVNNLRNKLESLKAEDAKYKRLRVDHISIKTILANKSPDDLVTRDVAPLIIDSGVLEFFERSDKGPEWDAFMFYKAHKLGVEYSDFHFPTAEQVVKAIKTSGGIAVLAHPGRITGLDLKSYLKNPAGTKQKLVETIKHCGFDTLEVKHKSHYAKGAELGSDTPYVTMLGQVVLEMGLIPGINSVDLHVKAEIPDLSRLASSPPDSWVEGIFTL